MRQISNRLFLLAVVATAVIAVHPVRAQWLKHPTPHAPRTSGGTINMSAPTPRAADGKPDFTGFWITGNPFCGQPIPDNELNCGLELPISKEGINFGIGLQGGLPYQPWLAELVKKRTAEDAKDDPHAYC